MQNIAVTKSYLVVGLYEASSRCFLNMIIFSDPGWAVDPD